MHTAQYRVHKTSPCKGIQYATQCMFKYYVPPELSEDLQIPVHSQEPAMARFPHTMYVPITVTPVCLRFNMEELAYIKHVPLVQLWYC